ncbi:MAG: hypothetical protein ACK5FT_07355 [Sphingomonadales bacterium]|jgi:hypothetical protein
MEDRKFYLRLNEAALETCKSWIGKEIASISTLQLQADWEGDTLYISPEIEMLLHPDAQAVKIWQEETDMEGLPVSYALRIDKEQVKHRPVVFQFNKPFKIRTVEIWAEKTRDSSGLRDTTQLTENTLVLTAETGDRWMLLPDHPGPGFVIARGETAMKGILHSGWYVLKHLLD